MGGLTGGVAGGLGGGAAGNRIGWRRGRLTGGVAGGLGGGAAGNRTGGVTGGLAGGVIGRCMADFISARSDFTSLDIVALLCSNWQFRANAFQATRFSIIAFYRSCRLNNR
jgi:hypothetical protein